MGNNPSRFSRAGNGKDKVKNIADADLKVFPVESVSWDDAQEFIKKLNERERGNGWTYRLPAEAEWEYACRGGATSEEECSFHFYLDRPTNDLSSKQANFSGDYPGAETGALPGSHHEGGFVPAEQARALRHARQRVGVVRGPVRRWPGPRVVRRRLGQRRLRLPGGEPWRPRAGRLPPQLTSGSGLPEFLSSS